MFKCGFCGSNSKHGEKLRRVVEATRTINHQFRHGAYPNSPTGKYDDPGGPGTQIVSEKNQCESCVKLTLPLDAAVS